MGRFTMSKRKQSSSLWSLGEEQPKAPYHYKGCGLEDVWLVSGYDEEVIDGERAVTIRNLDGLHKAIGRFLVRRKKLLSGKEIHFLRKQMDLTQSDLARLLGYNAQQIARYEKDENRMPGPADRLLRMIYRDHTDGTVSIRAVLEQLDELDSRKNERQVFQQTSDGWMTAVAA